jgi:threonine/homoserine/homoserine lactone efflux protein
MWLYLSQGLLLGGTAAAQPGPFQAYLLAQTLQNGWQRTLWAAFAPLISDGPIIFLVLLVLTQVPEGFLTGLQVAGGFFLIYLAYKAFVAFRTADFSQPPPPSARTNIFEAAMMNALSPGPYIFWATIAGPILLSGWRQSAGHGMSFLLGFYGTLIGGFMAFIALFAAARRLDPKVSRLLTIFSAVAMMGFALFQFWQAGLSLAG